MFVNQSIECRSETERLAAQTSQLRTVVERLYKKTTFYQERLQAARLMPDNVTSPHLLRQLPFLTAADLLANHPFGLLTAPVSTIARFEATADRRSATGFTRQDLNWQLEMIARGLVSCNVTMTSLLLLLPEDLDSAVATSLQQSAEAIGATVLVGDHHDPKANLRRIFDYGVTTLFGAPNAFLALAEQLTAIGYGPQDLALLNLICPQQLCSDTLRATLQDMFHAPVQRFFGHADLLPLGIASECLHCCGLHLQDDHFYPEIIDENGQPVAPGKTGELVLTTLSREVMPLLRYRSGVQARMETAPCRCGRTTPRLFFRLTDAKSI